MPVAFGRARRGRWSLARGEWGGSGWTWERSQCQVRLGLRWGMEARQMGRTWRRDAFVVEAWFHSRIVVVVVVVGQ